MEMSGMKQPPKLNEAVLDDADVIELVVNPLIKKLLVKKSPTNLLINVDKL